MDVCCLTQDRQPSAARRRVGIETIEDVISRRLRCYRHVNRNEYNI